MVLVGDTGSTGTAYTDVTATEPGETYAYRVRALRGEEKSQASNRSAAVIPRASAIFTDLDGGPPGSGPDDTTITPVDGEPPASAQQNVASGDFNLDDDNDSPRGIWSDRTTMWVADYGDDKIYAYRMTDDPATTATEYGTRDTSKEFNLADSTDEALDNGSAYGIWSDGTTMWVADNADNKLYAYRMTEDHATTATEYGTRDTSKEFNLHDDNDGPRGIWSDGTNMWVVDIIDYKLYAYRMTDDLATTTTEYGTRDTSKELDLHINIQHAWGVWSNETTMWVGDHVHRKLYAYALQTAVVNNPVTGQPTITGTAQVGETLTADLSDIDDDGIPPTWPTPTSGPPAATARPTPKSMARPGPPTPW